MNWLKMSCLHQPVHSSTHPGPFRERVKRSFNTSVHSHRHTQRETGRQEGRQVGTHTHTFTNRYQRQTMEEKKIYKNSIFYKNSWVSAQAGNIGPRSTWISLSPHKHKYTQPCYLSQHSHSLSVSPSLHWPDIQRIVVALIQARAPFSFPGAAV